MNYSASTPSPEFTHTLSSNQGPDEGVQISDPESPASITSPTLRDPTPPHPFIPTLAPPSPDQSAPEPPPPPEPRPNSVEFGPKIAEALPHAKTAHAPYHPPISPLTDYLAATAKETTRENFSALSLLSLLDSKQWKTLVSLPEGETHPAANLLRSYGEEGIPVHTSPPWSLQALETAISKEPHV